MKVFVHHLTRVEGNQTAVLRAVLAAADGVLYTHLQQNRRLPELRRKMLEHNAFKNNYSSITHGEVQETANSFVSFTSERVF